MNQELTPKTTNTTNKLCKLKRDNVSASKSWIMVSEKTVSITNQVSGEPATGSVIITKKDFERFIKFYETGL